MQLTCKILLGLTFFTLINSAYAQRGPGGVSQEVAGPNSNCKMWLDVSSINAIDGASISSWNDESLSINVNTPTQSDALFEPIYRNDPSESVNGEPVIRFIPDKYFELISSDDINANGPYTERTTFMVFRTGIDVSTRQMLWEQGGGIRGLNMYIYDDTLWFGGYDMVLDSDGAPSWGFVSTKTKIEPNTVYVITHMFDADIDGDLTTNDGSIYGYINGELFSVVDPINGVPATPVGALDTHPNAPGLGALNGGSYIETGAVSGTGTFAFLGDMVEFIAYDELLNDAERIIVENYLGSKYFANLVLNDYFDYQVEYGKELIGIGRDLGVTNFHNNSKGRNIFSVEADLVEFDTDQEYFLIGNNDADATSWTVTNAPNLGVRTQRIAREWRADHTGDLGDITVTFDANDLPAGITGYTKYCLVIDPANGPISNFNQTSTQVLEMTNTSGTEYEITTAIPNGAYITIAIVDPMVEFENAAESGFELTGLGTDNSIAINVKLNYIPATAVAAGLNVVNNTATIGAAPANDYDNILPNPGSGAINFSAGSQFSSINFDIMGDANPEATESFNMIITTLGITSDLDIGANNNLLYTIFDDDNIPKVAFALTNSSVSESVGVTTIEIVRTGSTALPANVDFRLRIPGGNGTATNGVDYTFVNGTASFAAGAASFLIPVTILDDLLDEPNETIILELFNNVAADIDAAFQQHELTVIDDDSQPEVSFAIASSQGPETNGTPLISVILSAPSTLTITVDYEDLLVFSATLGIDYTIGTTGTLTFVPGDTVEYLPLVITNDVINEPDETIDFELSPGTAVNATIGISNSYTYTIKDYSSFEWLGAAGVGQPIDNVFWLNAGELSGSNGSLVSTFDDCSPNNISITSSGSNRPLIDFTGPNGQKQLNFDGNDFFEIPGNTNINTNTYYTQKSIWVTFTTGVDVTTRQMIYEQGGSTRGISLYIENQEIYYNIWNNSDNNGPNSAWGTGSSTGSFNVVSSGNMISAGSDYIAVIDYSVNGVTGELNGYLNGELIGTRALSTPSGVPPRLYAHGDNGAIGGVVGSTRYHDNTGAASFFTGAIQELIYFSDAPINNARRIIIDNHLSVKYGIPLVNNQYFSLGYSGTYGNEIAGIGQFNSSESHTNSQGTSILRITNPSSIDPGDFLMWGHDSVDYSVPGTPVLWTLPPGFDNALHRRWKVSELGGDVGEIDLIFDLSNWTITSPSDLYLMVDSDDGNFVNATLIPITTYASGMAQFSGVNLSNDQWFTVGTFSSLNVLPIELLSFTALLNNEDNVEINWATATETHNDYFVVERSKDGLIWEPIITKPGAGTTTLASTYFDVDYAPLSGLSYYRLKQVDFDGTYTYSNIEFVNRNKNKGYGSFNMYPNPNKGNDLTIEFSEYSDDDLTINIIDPTGKLVAIKNINGDSRNGIVSLQLNHLPKGLYYLRASTGNYVETKKLIIE